MNITVWSNFSKKRNSTKQPSGSGTLIDVKLKSATSIENPSFILKGNNFDYNYAQAFNHYYFIDNITSLADDLIEISCSQDILATYKTDIGNYSGFVERAATNYDADVRDNLISAKQKIVSATSVDTAITNYTTTGSFIVRVQGKSGVESYVGSKSQVRTMFSNIFDLNLFSGEYGNIDFDFVTTGMQELQKLLFAMSFNPSNYIAGCKWFPFNPSSSASNVDIGFYSVDGGGMGKINQFAEHVNGAVSLPARYFNDFRDYDPSWSRYSIYIPGVGESNLDASSLSNGLNYDLAVDYKTGSCIVELTDNSGAHISTLCGNMGVDQQIGFADAAGATMQALANNFSGGSSDARPVANNATGGGGGGHSFGSSQRQPNRYAAAESIMSRYGIESGSGATETIRSGVATALTVASALPMFNSNTNIIGVPGNEAILKIHPNITVSVQRYGSKDIPSAVAGRPVYKNSQISSYSGYVQLSGASIDLAGLSGDRDAVNSFLNSGFYYE